MDHRSQLPVATQKEMTFEHGSAIGLGTRWEGGQYCAILTRKGLVGCGIYDIRIAGEFGQAVAICRGTPACPLVEPEDLLIAIVREMTAQAEALGVRIGMTGREAVETMLRSAK